MLLKRMKSDKGLMGPTHALSAVAFALLFTWLASDFMLDKILESRELIVFISAIIIIVGSALMPDLDAVNSTSINTLGVVGSILSKGMRGFSSIVQNIIKGPYDKTSDPHRGFWHTILSAFIMGGLATLLIKVNVIVFSIRDVPITLSTIIVTFFIYISSHLLLVSLFKPLYKKSKAAGGIIRNLTILAFSVLLVYLLPKELNYSWVGGAITFGWIAHILGDMMTVSGVPVLFPLKIKGKRWWDIRLPLGIKAGGFIEKTILIPIFSIIIIISLYNIIPLFL